MNMKVISIRKLRDFWSKPNCQDSEQQLRAWYAEAKKADWKTPNDIKKRYKSASFLVNNRVIFNIKGNSYRLIVAIKYEFKIIYIRFVGTHKQYDEIDAKTI